MFNSLQLENKNILLIGIGGGFDICAGLPLLFSLKANNNIVLANYSFTNFGLLPNNNGWEILEDYNNICRCNFQNSTEKYYFPEGWLQDRLVKKWGLNLPVYALRKTGVLPLKNAIKHIVKTHNIDTVLMLDGGIDSIMTGKEQHPGTILEDFVSLIAFQDPVLETLEKYVVCCGYGTEVEEQMNMLEGLRNFKGKVIDVKYLDESDEEFQFYKDVYEYAAVNSGKQSHIHKRIIKAAEGLVGMDESDGNDLATYTPFMQLWWLFDYNKVIKENIFIELLQNTKTFDDVIHLYMRWKNSQNVII